MNQGLPNLQCFHGGGHDKVKELVRWQELVEAAEAEEPTADRKPGHAAARRHAQARHVIAHRHVAVSVFALPIAVRLLVSLRDT